MIISWNELQRTCQKAFRGLGVPAGVDDDSAFSVLWLQAREFDALTPLAAALAALEHTPPRPLERRHDEGGAGVLDVGVLDAGGQPAVSIASDALDFAVARAVSRENRAETLLINVEGGIFVAGALPQRPVPGYCVQIEWRDGSTSYGLDVACNGEHRLCTASVDSPGDSLGDNPKGNLEDNPGNSTGDSPRGSAECNGGPVRSAARRNAVRIVAGEPDRGQWMDRSPSWRVSADEAELERRAARSVTRGIEVPGALWTRLLACVGRTLVPATHVSREQGAGGGEYND